MLTEQCTRLQEDYRQQEQKQEAKGQEGRKESMHSACMASSRWIYIQMFLDMCGMHIKTTLLDLYLSIA